MSTTSNKYYNRNSKDVMYINRDFDSLKSQLISFTKQYYPNTYKDFSESSPGQIFIEQAAYVGDVLSYYTDQQFLESFIQFATERKNIINSAASLGYKHKISSASNTTVEVFQLVPAEKYKWIDETNKEHIDFRPNSNYFLILKPYTQLSSTSGINFLIEDAIDFNQNTLYSPREITVYDRDQNTQEPLRYLVKKTAKAFSGSIITTTVSIGTLSSFLTLQLPEKNILKIISVTDSENNKYYEVDYLAQETIPISIDNISSNNEIFSQYQEETPKLLKYLRTERRFVTSVDENNNTFLRFGGNYDNFEMDVIIPNPTNVGVGLKNLHNLNIPLDGKNVLKNKSYGISPSNTNLTISYIVGGGLSSNVNADEINSIKSIDYLNDLSALSAGQREVFMSLLRNMIVRNITPATGGYGIENNETIRQNAIANFSSQYRAVTSEDILLRIYSMSSEFGSVPKAYVEPNLIRDVSFQGVFSGYIDGNTTKEYLDINQLNPLDRRKFLTSTNPFTNNIYLLGYNNKKHLTKCNEATIYNLKKYLDNYKILTDKYNFIDGYIINIGVEFKISIYSGYNKQTVLNSCVSTIKEFFDIDKWGFCQPINLSQLQFNVMNNEGVQSVSSIKIKNLTADDDKDGLTYSNIEYNISIATQNNIVYPSKDPSIFELKYPDFDIKGLVL